MAHVMEWFEREEAYEQRTRRGRNLWQYIPRKLYNAIEGCTVDSDGYWVYLKPGYVAYDGGEDCGIIHEYTIADIKTAIKTIRKA